MKTEALISRLAQEAAPVRPGAVQAWLAVGLVGGVALSAALLVAWLGVQPLGEAFGRGAFWMKAAYTLALAAAGWAMTTRMARPSGRLGVWPWLALAAFGVLGLAATAQVLAAAPAEQGPLLLGATWTACPWRILALSTPVLALLLLAMRRLAPTRLGLAGLAAGLLAGGLGATVYGLYCREGSPAFVAVWYSLGIGLSCLLGAVAGRRLLRW